MVDFDDHRSPARVHGFVKHQMVGIPTTNLLDDHEIGDNEDQHFNECSTSALVICLEDFVMYDALNKKYFTIHT